MKSRAATFALWCCLITALLLVISGLRDIFAPGFFNMSPTVRSKLDVTLEFAAAAIFLIAAASFYMSRRRPDGEQKEVS